MSSTPVDLGHGITLLDAEYMEPGIAAVYIMQQGDQIAIVETGTAHTVPNILAMLKSRGLGIEHVAYVIPTHVHLDHAGGAGELMHRCPGARLVIHPYGARHMINPEKLQQGTIAVYGEEKFNQLYGDLRPVDPQRVIEADDDFELDFNGRRLRFLDTPGHARHHFCVYDETSRGIFTGDTFGLSYPRLQTKQGPYIFPTTTPVQFDPQALKDSVARLMSLHPESMYLTHYGRITPGAEIVKQLLDGIDAFTEMALAEKDSGEKRHANIAETMMDYLLQNLRDMDCQVAEDICRKLLQNDVTLNTQGLEVWLDRSA